MNSPEADDFSFIFQEEDIEDSMQPTIGDEGNDLFELDSLESDIDLADTTESEELNISSITTDDDFFTMIRMELEQSRSSQLEQLESVVASSVATGQEKNEAFKAMQEIDQLSSKEFFLEESLKEEYGYPDVLVRTLDNRVIITVKADEMSEQEANQIMRAVYDEFGSVQVEVKFQPITS